MASNIHSTTASTTHEAPRHIHGPNPTNTTATQASPPSKRDLKSWWKNFSKLSSKHEETQHGEHPSATPPASPPPYPFSPEVVRLLDRALFNAVVRLFSLPDKDFISGVPLSCCVWPETITTTLAVWPSLRNAVTAAGSCLRVYKGPCLCAQTVAPMIYQLSESELTYAESKPQGIFGVPLRQSITYANVAISLVDDNGKSYIYGYVPIVVAKCGVFLKEKGA